MAKLCVAEIMVVVTVVVANVESLYAAMSYGPVPATMVVGAP